MEIVNTFSITEEEEVQKKLIQKCKDSNLIWYRLNLSKILQYRNIDIVYKKVKLIREEHRDAKIIVDLPFPGNYPRIYCNVKNLKKTKGEIIEVYNNSIQNEVFINVENLINYFTLGKEYLYDGGKGVLKVISIKDNKIIFQVMNTFLFNGRKSIVSDKLISHKELSKEIIHLLNLINPDKVWFSFSEDIKTIEKCMNQLTGVKQAGLKIETKKGYEKLDILLKSGYDIIIARGDLCLDLDISHLFDVQSDIISRCKKSGNKVYIATDILSSIREGKVPSRAEIIDVSLAVKSNVDGIMLNVKALHSDFFEFAINFIRGIKGV